MTLDQFFLQWNRFVSDSVALQRQSQAYRQALVQAQSQTVCTTTFSITLQNLQQLNSTYNTNYNNLLETAVQVRNSYDALDDEDKRNNNALGAMSNLTNTLNQASSTRYSISSLSPSLADLENQYNSCLELKEPTTTSVTTQTDPNTSQNKQPEDQNTTRNTSPNLSSSNGQKATANSENATEANINILPELLTINSLSNFSSYTYNITLYMVTPEAYNEMLYSMTRPSSGCFIVAKSGGFSKSDPRALPLSGSLNNANAATGPGYDYFIDDLKINSVYPTKSNMQSAVVVTEIGFKIYEPHGFGFLQRIAQASAEIKKKSPILANKKEPPMPFQMLYLLEIAFTGYDENGKVLPSRVTKGQNNEIDTLQRIFPLQVGNVKTKLDGRVVVYDWSATVPNERLGLGQIYGTIKSKISYEARTVGEAIGSLNAANRASLLGALNDEQRDLKEKGRQTFVNIYDVDYGTEVRIRDAQLIDDEDVYKPNSAMSGAKNVEQVNPKTAGKAVTFNVKTKKGEMPQGMSIVNVIDQLIYKSTYVTEALNKVNNERLEVQSKDKLSRVELEWFIVKPRVEIKEWDEPKNYWVMKTTYQIQSYKIPFIRTQYADKKSRYYGPLKRYYYWFTGQNTEVISYEQTYDSLYYILQPYSVNVDNSARGRGEGRVPLIPDSSGGSSSAVGKANGGSKINESVKYSLYSPGDQATAQITIMGDPDYLMETIGGSLDFARASSSYLFSRFYSKRGSINPYAGQLYIEIIFKTAEDYSNQTGLMMFNPNLLFYGNYESEKLLGNKGIIYLITNVESMMRRGKFTQQLQLVIVPPDQLIVSTGAAGDLPANGRQIPENSAQDPRARGFRRGGTPDTTQSPTDSRQPSVNPRNPNWTPVPDTQLEPPIAINTNTSPLQQSVIVTASATGQQTANDDANANNGRVIVADSGRETDAVGGTFG